MSDLSEAELHVQAMRLVCEALADREQNGIEVDWNVLRQMHDQMDAMLQELQHKHRYDSSEIVDLRKELDAARADNVDLRRQNTGYLQTQLDAARAVNVELQGQLDVARADNVEIRKRLNDETDRHNKTNAEKVDLFQKLEWANKHCSELVNERDAAHQTILMQRAGIERLQEFVQKARQRVTDMITISDVKFLRAALAELDAEPTPVAEPVPCPECETTLQKLADANKQWQLVAQQREEDRKKLREYEQVIAQGNSAMDAARKKIAEQEAQVADLNDKLAAKTLAGASNLCREIERLQAFVGMVRNADCYTDVLRALSELDPEPTPATDAEGDTCP